MLKKPDKVFSTQLITVSDEYLLQLIEVYPLKHIKKYIKIPNSLYPMLLEIDNNPEQVKRLSLSLAIAKLNVGYTPTELDKYHIPEIDSLRLLHLKLNEVKPRMEEQVYCSDKKTHQLKWVIKRNKKSLADTLAVEIRDIFQSNTNLRQFAY